MYIARALAGKSSEEKRHYGTKSLSIIQSLVALVALWGESLQENRLFDKAAVMCLLQVKLTLRWQGLRRSCRTDLPKESPIEKNRLIVHQFGLHKWTWTNLFRTLVSRVPHFLTDSPMENLATSPQSELYFWLLEIWWVITDATWISWPCFAHMRKTYSCSEPGPNSSSFSVDSLRTPLHGNIKKKNTNP